MSPCYMVDVLPKAASNEIFFLQKLDDEILWGHKLLIIYAGVTYDSWKSWSSNVTIVDSVLDSTKLYISTP